MTELAPAGSPKSSEVKNFRQVGREARVKLDRLLTRRCRKEGRSEGREGEDPGRQGRESGPFPSGRDQQQDAAAASACLPGCIEPLSLT